MKKLFLFLFLLSCTPTRFKNPVFNEPLTLTGAKEDYLYTLSPQTVDNFYMYPILNGKISFMEAGDNYVSYNQGNQSKLTFRIVGSTDTQCLIQAIVENTGFLHTYDLTAPIPCPHAKFFPKQGQRWFYKRASGPINPDFFTPVAFYGDKERQPFFTQEGDLYRMAIEFDHYPDICQLIQNTPQEVLFECAPYPNDYIHFHPLHHFFVHYQKDTYEPFLFEGTAFEFDGHVLSHKSYYPSDEYIKRYWKEHRQ